MVATLTFALGHVAPFWVRQDAVAALGVPALDIGLWFQCPESGDCFNHDFATDRGKRALVGGGGGGWRVLVVLVVLAVVVCCCF